MTWKCLSYFFFWESDCCEAFVQLQIDHKDGVFGLIIVAVDEIVFGDLVAIVSVSPVLSEISVVDGSFWGESEDWSFDDAFLPVGDD